jgi:hypothetical protein
MKQHAKPFELTSPDTMSEHALQIACTRMLQRVLLPTVAWTAIDHGHSFDMRIGRRGVPIGLLEAQKRVARGVRPGLPDYAFWHAGDSFAIELKTLDGTLSPEQKNWLRSLIANKVHCRVCCSQNLVFDTVVEWGLTRRMKVAA